MSHAEFFWTGVLLTSFVWSFLFLFFAFMCRHAWKPVVERELPSRAEELNRVGATWETKDDTGEIASRTFVAVLACEKCGGCKKFVVRT